MLVELGGQRIVEVFKELEDRGGCMVVSHFQVQAVLDRDDVHRVLTYWARKKSTMAGGAKEAVALRADQKLKYTLQRTSMICIVECQTPNEYRVGKICQNRQRKQCGGCTE